MLFASFPPLGSSLWASAVGRLRKEPSTRNYDRRNSSCNIKIVLINFVLIESILMKFLTSSGFQVQANDFGIFNNNNNYYFTAVNYFSHVCKSTEWKSFKGNLHTSHSPSTLSFLYSSFIVFLRNSPAEVTSSSTTGFQFQFRQYMLEFSWSEFQVTSNSTRERAIDPFQHLSDCLPAHSPLTFYFIVFRPIYARVAKILRLSRTNELHIYIVVLICKQTATEFSF